MNKSNNPLWEAIAKIAENAARYAAGAASFVDFHQPKEPTKLIQELKKKA